MSHSIISTTAAKRLASYYHSYSPYSVNITALSHGCSLPDGPQGLILELERELRSSLGDDPQMASELRALIDYARSL